ncbi:hypothetical protein SLEP1_g52333 [Rubroshorea leprosula]|uniref:Uncharacterized protein n=1 Tax=Rubroshorea leprosula TaxID=152421 RepID=A0AAV5M6Q7_9ROSI|nr:hypothetical protein SLEP1_g52333 [Rubroshorea leprosula]
MSSSFFIRACELVILCVELCELIILHWSSVSSSFFIGVLSSCCVGAFSARHSSSKLCELVMLCLSFVSSSCYVGALSDRHAMLELCQLVMLCWSFVSSSCFVGALSARHDLLELCQLVILQRSFVSSSFFNRALSARHALLELCELVMLCWSSVSSSFSVRALEGQKPDTDSSGQMQERCRHLFESVDPLRFMLHIFQLDLGSASRTRQIELEFIMLLSSAARVGVLHHAFELGSSCLSSASCFQAWQLLMSSSAHELVLEQDAAPAPHLAARASALHNSCASSSQFVLLQTSQLALQQGFCNSCTSRKFVAHAPAGTSQLVEIFILASCLANHHHILLIARVFLNELHYKFLRCMPPRARRLLYYCRAELLCLAELGCCAATELDSLAELDCFGAVELGCCDGTELDFLPSWTIDELDCFAAAKLGCFAAVDLGDSFVIVELGSCFATAKLGDYFVTTELGAAWSLPSWRIALSLTSWTALSLLSWATALPSDCFVIAKLGGCFVAVDLGDCLVTAELVDNFAELGSCFISAKLGDYFGIDELGGCFVAAIKLELVLSHRGRNFHVMLDIAPCVPLFH